MNDLKSDILSSIPQFIMGENKLVKVPPGLARDIISSTVKVITTVFKEYFPENSTLELWIRNLLTPGHCEES